MGKAWAYTKEGKITVCIAPEEDRGRGRCNHVAHQKKGESLEDFIERVDFRKIGNPSTQVILSPYRMLEEEKNNLDEIRGRKQLQDKDCEGGYISLGEPLWNDMDKKYFNKESKITIRNLNKVLHGSSIVIWVSSRIEKEVKYKVGQVVSPEDAEQINSKYSGLIILGKGTSGLNKFAKMHYKFEATSDIYVLPYYMRQDPPDGESKHPLNVLYNKVILKRANIDDQQLAYEQLLDNENAEKQTLQRGGYAVPSLSDELKGKSGVMRGIMTGRKLCYTGRTVLNVDANMEYGDVKVPCSVLCKIYRPTITSHLEKKGNTKEQIASFFDSYNYSDQAKVKEEDAKKLDDIVSNAGVRVIINRQPSLHQSSLLAFRPRAAVGSTTKISPQTFAGLGGDLDGDTITLIGINDIEISNLADKEIGAFSHQATYLPRHRATLLATPSKEAAWGLLNILSQRSK